MRPQCSAIGLDFGTSSLLSAASAAGRVRLLTDPRGRVAIPTRVAFGDGGRAVVGFAAHHRLRDEPEALEAVPSFRHWLGALASEDEPAPASWAAGGELVDNGRGELAFVTGGGLFTAEELSALVLPEAAQLARPHFEIGKVIPAVATVPSDTSAQAKTAFQRAARLAGIHLLSFVEQSIAVVSAEPDMRAGRHTVCVCDFGAGGFEVSIVDVRDGQMRTLASHRSAALGGDQVDRRLAEGALSRGEAAKFGEFDDGEALAYRIACERGKCELRSHSSAPVSFLVQRRRQQVILEQAELASVAYDLVEAAVDVTRRCLDEVEMSVTQISRVIVVGGGARLPLATEAVSQFVDRSPSGSVDGATAVAIGAAVCASAFAN